MGQSPNALRDRPLTDPADQRSKTIAQATYYRRRAEDHRLMALRALPAARPVHEQLEAAYRMAAIAAEKGEAADLGGDHRAEGHGSLDAHGAKFAVAAE